MPMAFHVQPVETKDGRTVYRVSLDQHGVAAVDRLVTEPPARPALPDGFGFGAERGGLRAVHGTGERSGHGAQESHSPRGAESKKPAAHHHGAGAPRRTGTPVRLGPAASRAGTGTGHAPRSTARLRLVTDPA
ncbi:hypothetical protein [Streptomyces lonarensis]|uniref:Uncharacterized protein n=1 Tax=Streptomyces lonarensis TaxID=700599 RepID=A0A7X6CZ58_9ACTN|nr:hypothetical protein [Streptomyces lonarensis]NJQ05244.1 hypothetical protein [Streptomyces lonarensis]